MKKVFILGLGNLGKRHLQSVANIEELYKIICYDTEPKALDSVNIFCRDNSIQIDNIQLDGNLENTINLIDSKSIIIVSSTANGRDELLLNILDKKPLAIIVEKPVTQGLKEYEAVMEKSLNIGIPIYINYIAHMQPIFQQIYSELADSKEFTIYTNLPNWGIACVGIHQIELFTWLFNLEKCKIVSSNVKSVYEQKREGFYDIAGNLVLQTESGNICVINNTQNQSIASIQIITENKIYNIFEEQEKIVIVDSESGVNIENIEYVFVSQYTQQIIKDIFLNNQTNLIPDITQGYLSHKLLFEFMDTHNINNINIT